VDGWMDGWMDGRMDGWMDLISALRIAYSNQKISLLFFDLLFWTALSSPFNQFLLLPTNQPKHPPTKFSLEVNQQFQLKILATSSKPCSIFFNLF
jgi:hypothetical protein